MEFIVFNESFIFIRLNWNGEIFFFIDDSVDRGIKIDYYFVIEENLICSIFFCDNSMMNEFSNLSIFIKYCFIVVVFYDDNIVIKLDNKECVYMDEEGMYWLYNL